MMNRKNVKKMLDGIEDKYIEEAVTPIKSVHKNPIRQYRKIAAAAVIALLVTGTGVSALAAKGSGIPILTGKNSIVQNWIRSFTSKEAKTNEGQGIHITKDDNTSEDDTAITKNTDPAKTAPAETQKPAKHYLALHYLPEGYQCKSNDTSIYYGPKGDTDFFTIAYFHLQTDFTNILPQADAIDKYETTAGTAYIASSKYENRAWILFRDGDYMMEFRDSNKGLSKKELRKILDNAQLSAKKPSVAYKTLEWTKDLQESYEQALKKYNVHP